MLYRTFVNIELVEKTITIIRLLPNCAQCSECRGLGHGQTRLDKPENTGKGDQRSESSLPARLALNFLGALSQVVKPTAKVLHLNDSRPVGDIYKYTNIHIYIYILYKTHVYTEVVEVTGTNADLTLARGSGLLAEMHFPCPLLFGIMVMINCCRSNSE